MNTPSSWAHTITEPAALAIEALRGRALEVDSLQSYYSGSPS
jgi:hypothetical protein